MRLNKRWFEPPEHEQRRRYAETLVRKLKRFVVNHSGRRSWKTETAKRALVWTARNTVNMNYLVGAPVQAQAKRVYWGDFKALTRNDVIIDRSDGDLWLKFATGSMIQVAGMDKPERFEGFPWHGIVLDEYGNMKANTLDEVVLPMLADTKGWLWALGVPEGRNHYYDLVEAIRLKKWRPDESEIFHWHSREIMDPVELAAMEAVYDEQMFAQEFGGEFVHFAGRAYYAFDEKLHCKPVRELYDKKAPLVFCFDFNVDPGVAAVLQPRKLPNGLDGDAVIGEVYIPRNSNTEVVARQLAHDWADHEGRIHLYGDFTGGARGSAKIRGSDWDIIQQILRAVFGADRIHIDVPHNPSVRRRVNAVNARLRAVNGDIRLMVDPKHAPHVVKDLEGVTILEGTSGEIDKKSAPQLSHMCFTADTVVETADGFSRLDMAPRSGLVRGFDGNFVPYTNAGKTGTYKDIVSVSIAGGIVVRCTPEHQWLTDGGWKCARDLKGARLITHGLVSQALTDRTLTGKSSIGMMGKSAIFGGQAGRESNTFTGWCIRTLTGQSQMDLTSIMSMATGPTTRLKIWNALRRSSTFKGMRRKTRGQESLRAPRAWRRPARPQKHGTLAQRAVHGIASMHIALRRTFTLAPSHSYVSIADVNSYPSRGSLSIAARNASPLRDTTLSETTKNEAVRRAAEYLKQTSTQEQNIAAGNALDVLDVRPAGKADVYCLFVERDGCFALSNGVIVSNSDALGYYIHRMYPPGLAKEAKIGNLY